MCWCVSVCPAPLMLKSQQTGIVVIKSGVVTSAAMLTFQLGDCMGSHQFFMSKFKRVLKLLLHADNQGP